MKKLLSILLVLVLMLATAACGTQVTAPPTSPEVASSTVDVAVTPPAKQPSEVTDPEVLDELWRCYVGKSSPMLNSAVTGFASVSPYEVASAAFRLYLATNSRDTLSLVEIPADICGSQKPRQGIALSLEQATEYVERCFNAKLADPEGYFAGLEMKNAYGPLWLPDTKQLAIDIEANNWNPPDVGYGEAGQWGLKLTSVLDNGDNTLTVTMSSPNSQTGKVDSAEIYQMGCYDDGGYYFITAKREYYNNNNANLQGDYRKVELADGMISNVANLSLVYQGDDFAILYNEGRDKAIAENHARIELLRINTKTATVDKVEYAIIPYNRKEGLRLNVAGSSKGILIMSAQGLMQYSLDLALVKSAPLPELLTPLMIEREFGGGENSMYPTKFFGDFVLNWDCTKLYYSNHEGLTEVDLATGDSKLLVAPQYGPSGGIMEGAIICPNALELIDNETKLRYFTYGYESIDSAVELDLATGKATKFEVDYFGVPLDEAARAQEIIAANSFKSDIECTPLGIINDKTVILTYSYSPAENGLLLVG